jgi:hypothetical protein
MIFSRPDYNEMTLEELAAHIPEEEPVFLIRGQDASGAQVVRDWARYNQAQGGDPLLTQMALDHAAKMDAWPKHKLADIPDEWKPLE